MQVPGTNGGSMEATIQSPRVPNFQAMSNELSTPKILVCPRDENRSPATSFASLTDRQLSYFLCQNPAEAGTPGLLTGDRNLTNALVQGTRAIFFTTVLSLSWTKEMHSRQGNVGFNNGSVVQFRNGEFTLKRHRQEARANRLLLPKAEEGTSRPRLLPLLNSLRSPANRKTSW